MERYSFITATVLAVVSILLLSGVQSCSLNSDMRDGQTVTVNGRVYPSASFMPGTVRIKVSEQMFGQFDPQVSAGSVDVTGVKSVDDALAVLGGARIERTFPDAGKYEPRHRKAGLHLWFDISFDEGTPLSKAGDELSLLEGVQYVEYEPRIVLIGGESPVIPVKVESPSVTSGNNMPFNDPMLPDQWHYNNDGTMDGSVAGADIDVFKVWERRTTGSEEVIVAIVDGGVDYVHEDLADNMWHNPDPSVSGNSVYGYNFCTDSYKINPHEHGTHVAGTVAAVNNNGTGVAGIAGGNAAAGIAGVRLMSCQIFDYNEKGEEYGAPGREAIVWAADHGAVIAQNSWGYSFETDEDRYSFETPQSDKDAFDYFTKYAGMETDEDGNIIGQSGPMAGGLVIFAAGNDSRNIGYPGDYETCLAVTALAADYKPAYYTNFGDWTDIMSPGGDYYQGLQVLSTIPGNQYGLMQGTSMACPHVSGVAALLISEFGGNGFTGDDLRKLLLDGARDISEYNSRTDMGAGLVDAARSFALRSTVAPDPVDAGNVSVTVNSNIINSEIVLPDDEDDAAPYYIRTYYSLDDFSSTSGVEYFEVRLEHGVRAGDKVAVKGMLSGFDATYVVKYTALDLAGNESDLSEPVFVQAGSNSAPVITPLDGVDTVLKVYETVYLNFSAYDPDGHSLKAEVVDAPGVSVMPVNDTLYRVTIYGEKAGPGTFDMKLVISDEFGLSAVQPVSYTVMNNNAPVVERTIGDIVVGYGEARGQNIELSEYFSDPDGDRLSYISSSSDKSVVTVAVNNSSLVITPTGYGTATVTVTAMDGANQSAVQSFRVLVRDASLMADLYPNPVVDTLNVRPAYAVSAASLSVRSLSGGTVLTQDFGAFSPFAPVAVDMTSLTGGVYILTLTLIEEDGSINTTTAEITKL